MIARRPVFVPTIPEEGFVREIMVEMPWASGFALIQKKKNIISLHRIASDHGYSPLLEVSSKSEELVGRHLSAFHLKVKVDGELFPLECVYQGSKVFENGGPFTDLYLKDPRESKKDSRLHDSGKLIGFEFYGRKFPLFPRTVFYDWIYLNALYEHRDWIFERLTKRRKYAGFTDIEFNPNKSINCQARSCALFVSLVDSGKFEEFLQDEEFFINRMQQAESSHSFQPMDRLAV